MLEHIYYTQNDPRRSALAGLPKNTLNEVIKSQTSNQTTSDLTYHRYYIVWGKVKKRLKTHTLHYLVFSACHSTITSPDFVTKKYKFKIEFKVI